LLRITPPAHRYSRGFRPLPYGCLRVLGRIQSRRPDLARRRVWGLCLPPESDQLRISRAVPLADGLAAGGVRIGSAVCDSHAGVRRTPAQGGLQALSAARLDNAIMP